MSHKSFSEQGQKIAMERAIELASPILPWFRGSGNLLDFGCGIGHLGYYISEKSMCKLISLDVRKYPLSHPAVKVELFDGKTIPYPNNSFDMSFIAYTLHHTKDPVAILRELIRVSRNKIVVSEDLLKTRWHIPIEVTKDIISNCFYAHITMQYKTIMEWEQVFIKLGLSVKEKVLHDSGSWLRFEHVSWLLEKNNI